MWDKQTISEKQDSIKIKNDMSLLHMLTVLMLILCFLLSVLLISSDMIFNLTCSDLKSIKLKVRIKDKKILLLILRLLFINSCRYWIVCQNLANNSHIIIYWLSCYFDLFWQYIFLHLFDAENFWYWFEWQLHNNNHIHEFLWSVAASYSDSSEKQLREIVMTY